ncbi:ketopantoate reductase family protein [Microlunatus phosphovorus]|uniref:ketopantoate reductase family protein n=1 Tax=Microlunatus phosphovorus TaxID=29405 RepID=UPI001E5080C3|nr:2-dehydropantoate 2-reductase N-terminal domain-containing protein [Microlunatus phosphovorus]
MGATVRILMFGRGVIATIYGQAFQEAGHDVEFLVRPGRAAEYGESVQTDLIDTRRALRGQRTASTFKTRLRESVELENEFDLVVLSVGHHQLREAAAYLAPRVGAATVLVFGNVWDEPLAAVAPIPANQVIFGFPQAGGGFTDDGVLHGGLLRSVILGTTGASPSRRELTVRAAFQQAGLRIKEEADMRGWLWLHFASDAGMFSQALKSGGLANMIGDRRALREAFLTSRELLPVLKERGVDLRRHPEAMLPYRLPRLTGTAFALATLVLPIARASLAAHTDPNVAEPRAVLDDALRTSRQLNIATPRLEQSVR